MPFMTLGQAAYRNIAKLRRPSWEPGKSIELQFDLGDDGKPAGTVGPYVKLRENGTEVDQFILDFNEDEDWEPAPE